MSDTQQAFARSEAREDSRDDRDRALAAMFKNSETVWLVDEKHDVQLATWRIDLIRRGMEERWMRQRYLYDIPSGVVFFLGHRPVGEEELMRVRRDGKKLLPAL